MELNHIAPNIAFSNGGKICKDVGCILKQDSVSAWNMALLKFGDFLLLSIFRNDNNAAGGVGCRCS